MDVCVLSETVSLLSYVYLGLGYSYSCLLMLNVLLNLYLVKTIKM